MKTVNEEALRQKLDAARRSTPEEQKAYLQSIDYVFDNEHSVVVNTMMDDSDLKWLKPLAQELFLPAVEIVVDGMNRKLRCWEEDIIDEETHQTITLMRWDIDYDKTVFTRDPDLIAEIKNTILSQLTTLDDNSLHRLNIPLYGFGDVIEEELYRRGDPGAIERRGDLYRWGDEENGIFIDYAEAKKYYDRAGVEFDPEEAAREWRKDATESFPDFATYRIEGSDVPAVKQMLQLLNERFGEHSEPFMYMPLEVVMKILVGSSAYVGYIQTIDEVEGNPDAVELEVEFYGIHPDCLKFALEQAFPNLKVEFTVHAP